MKKIIVLCLLFSTAAQACEKRLANVDKPIAALAYRFGITMLVARQAVATQMIQRDLSLKAACAVFDQLRGCAEFDTFERNEKNQQVYNAVRAHAHKREKKEKGLKASRAREQYGRSIRIDY